MEVAAYLHTVGEESRQWNPAADDWGTPKERGCRGGVPLWSVRPLHLPLAVKCGDPTAGTNPIAVGRLLSWVVKISVGTCILSNRLALL